MSDPRDLSDRRAIIGPRTLVAVFVGKPAAVLAFWRRLAGVN